MLPEWLTQLESCLRRIRRWPTPPNWSRLDWREELWAQGAAAACQAVRDFDPSRGVPLAAFVYQRMRASLYTRYRQEWTYAARTLCRSDPEVTGKGGGDAPDLPEDLLLLQSTLAQLRRSDRALLELLFWQGETECEIAERLGISHQAVSKRKRAILTRLRARLSLRE